MGFPAGGGIVHIEMKELEEAGSVRLSRLEYRWSSLGIGRKGMGAHAFWVDDHGPVLPCVDMC